MRLEAAATARNLWSWWEVPALALITAGCWWRVSDLTASSLWIDELWTVHRMRLPDVGAVLADSLENRQPPLYMLAMWAWGALFGVSEASARMPSLIIGCVTLPLVYLLARRWFGRLAALAALALLALSPVGHYFAQEARAYALILLASLGLLHLGFRLITAPTDPRRRLWTATAFGAVAVLMVQLNYVAVLFVLTLGLALIAAAAALHGTRAGLHLLALHIAIAAIAVPLPLWHLIQPGGPRWLEFSTLRVTETLGLLGHWTAIGRLLVMGSGLLLVWQLMTRWRGGPGRWTPATWRLVVLAVACFAPLALAMAVSVVIEPVVLPRYLLPSFGAGILLTAALATRWLSERRAPAALALALPALVAAEIALDPVYFTEPRRDQLRQAASDYLASRAAHGEVPYIACDLADFAPLYLQLLGHQHTPFAQGCTGDAVAAAVARVEGPHVALLSLHTPFAPAALDAAAAQFPHLLADHPRLQSRFALYARLPR